MKFDENTFLNKLSDNGFLPKEVTDNLPNYRQFDDSDGIPVDYWSKTDDEGYVIQKIEVEAPNGVMTRYHYKAYDFQFVWPEKKLTMDEGKALALKFIKEFRPDISGLSWSRGEWYLSIYDPGNMEAWVASDKDHEYGVMVNLNAGTVDFFSQEIKK